MATQASLDALDKTIQSIDAIKEKLKPFFEILQEEENDADEDEAVPVSSESNKKQKKKGAIKKLQQNKYRISKDERNPHRRALAQAAVALSVGTLRVLGARLRGLDRGRKADDPLRKDLNRIRSVLVSVQKAHKEHTDTSDAEAANESRAKEDDASGLDNKRRASTDSETGKEEEDSSKNKPKNKKKRRSKR